MADRVARIKGIALIPGVSRNGRFYSKELIGRAVSRMQDRIQAGGDPITMVNSHGAADPIKGNATDVVGRVTNVWQDDDGRAHYEADIADTTAGRDVAALLTATTPYIGPVSIRGSFLSEPRRVKVKGPSGEVEAWTGDDMEIDGIDFTNKPGVPGSRVESASLAEGIRPANCYQVLESAEAEVYLLTENATTEIVEGGNAPGNGTLPYGKVKYADPGYRKDGQKRYPIDTKAHVRAAWAYINTEKDAAFYTSSQLKRIKSRIKAAAKKFGIQITESIDSLAADFAPIIEAYIEENADLAEAYAQSTIDSGSTSVTVSGYATDGGKTGALAARVALAAIAAINCLDPDDDGDVDLRDTPADAQTRTVMHGDDGSDDDLIECAACGDFIESVSKFCSECGATTTAESAGDAARTESEAATVADTPTSGADVSPTTTTEGAGAREETITMAEGTQAPATYTAEQLQEAVAKAAQEAATKAAKKAAKAARKAAKAATEAASAPVATTDATEGAPAAPAVAEGTEAVDMETIRAAALEEARREVAEQMRQDGTVGRKGLTEGAELAEAKDAAALAGMSSDELTAYAAEAWSALAAKGEDSVIFERAPRLARGLARR